ncbi:MAG TPA: class I SAM-dependent rRNA methyltransferase [Thermoanaerobaculia bacterium]|nr:class I SAM-dependent rRNA methyltransferase [Thermoanaerobaculia bacterium]
MSRLVLKPGHVKPVWAGHPWVYAQAVARIEGPAAAGDVVAVEDAEGNVLGEGYYSPRSAIPVRLLTRGSDERVAPGLLAERIAAAAARRRELLALPSTDSDGFRLVHAEGDGLPGLVVDAYGDTACAQLLTAGIKRREEEVYDALAALPGVARVVEVGSRDSERLEGFRSTTRTVRGSDTEALTFRERGIGWRIPLGLAQKTGFYFDQRENRGRVEALAAGRRVLDAYSYVGGFALAAARGGARGVVAVDRSEAVLAAGRENAAANGLTDLVEWRRGDARRDLRRLAAAGERFDLVVVDPPKLAPTARHLPAARRAYRQLDTAALGLVAAGGLLVTCSCSAAFGVEDLLRTLAAAGRRTGRRLAVLHVGQQAPDHPTPPAFPEGRYLKCAFVAVD